MSDEHSGQTTLPPDPNLDAIRDRFQADWRAGRQPRIEDWLREIDDTARPRLLQELVALEVEMREVSGARPTAQEYKARFPELNAGWLAGIFAAQDMAMSAGGVMSPVSSLAPSIDRVSPPTRAKRIRCPHCHNPINLIDDKSDEVLCPGCGSSFTVREARHTDTTSGSRPLGKYQLLERVGLGAFGAVWKARDTELDRIVALKIPHTGLLTNDAEMERFKREARAAAQLRHPGIVTVYDVEMLEGLPTIVSDFISGAPLRDLLQTRKLTSREAATLIADVAEAVHYAHSVGVVHRDLKPANILMQRRVDSSQQSVDSSDGNKSSTDYRLLTTGYSPTIADFGLALRNEAEVTMTMDGHIIGTPAYMSPEQAAGKAHDADARSDVYSLGVIFYELLTGELPFRGSRAVMLSQVIHETPQRPRKLTNQIPRDLETICLKCLEKKPAQRYATGKALSGDLRRWLRNEPIMARPAGNLERGWRWCRRNPLLAALAAALLLAIAMLLILGIMVLIPPKPAKSLALTTELTSITVAEYASPHFPRV